METAAEFIARVVAAGWLVACATLAAHACARRLLPVASLLERLVATVVCGLWLSTLGFHALAALGAYALVPALVGSGALLGAALWADRRAPSVLRRDARGLCALARRALRGPARRWNLAFLVCAAPIALRPLLLPPLGWDSLTYHAVKAALFIQHRGALPMSAPGTWSYYRDRWGGSEVLTSWAMLPLRSDLLATLPELLQWLCLGVCVLCLARAVGARAPLAGAAAAFYLSLPTLRLLVGSGYSEPATCLCFAAATLFVLRYAKTRRRGFALLAAAAIGLALGMKIVFARACLVLLAALGWALLRRRPADGGLVLTAIGAALALAAPVLPWALRVMAETGLPLSPLPITVLGIELGRRSPEMAWLMARVPEAGSALAQELRALSVVLGSPAGGREVLSFLALVPLGFALIGAATQLRRKRFEIPTLSLALVADLVTYFSADMTAARIRWATTAGRFLLAAVLLALVLSVAWTPLAARAARGYEALLRGCALLLLLFYAPVGWSPHGAALAAGVLAALALSSLVPYAVRRAARGVRVAVSTLTALAALGGLHALREQTRYALMQSDYSVHPHPTFFVPAAQQLDRPERPLRIAVTGGPAQDMDRWFSYPFFGRALQNELLYVSPRRDGRVPSYGGPRALDELGPEIDARAWIARLRRERVDCLVTFDPLSLERVIADANPHIFRRISAPELRAFGAFELRARAVGVAPPPGGP